MDSISQKFVRKYSVNVLLLGHNNDIYSSELNQNFALHDVTEIYRLFFPPSPDKSLNLLPIFSTEKYMAITIGNSCSRRPRRNWRLAKVTGCWRRRRRDGRRRGESQTESRQWQNRQTLTRSSRPRLHRGEWQRLFRSGGKRPFIRVRWWWIRLISCWPSSWEVDIFKSGQYFLAGFCFKL